MLTEQPEKDIIYNTIYRNNYFYYKKIYFGEICHKKKSKKKFNCCIIYFKNKHKYTTKLSISYSK